MPGAHRSAPARGASSGRPAYAVSKDGLSQVVTTECGERGIRANAMLPGGTETPKAWAQIAALFPLDA
ncbi:hypothetical protein V2J97_01010 [Pseudomonas alliivorans]|nr:hypothetical protein [Pseudomonas alliivorans]